MAEGPQDHAHAEPSNFSAFDHLLDTCRRTRAGLLAVIGDADHDGAAIRDLLAREALSHVESVIEGLVLLARTGQFSGEELRVLVRRAGIVGPPAAGSPEARAAEHEAANERGSILPIDGRTILAAGHARVVFSIIPQLPSDAVAWPRPHRTYADIPVPRSEGELMLRAEELARVLWRVAAGDERRDEPLRRTLAFYDAGSRLSFRGSFRAA